LASFADRHVAAISYCVTLLNAEAPVVISSEMMANGQSAATTARIRARPETFQGAAASARQLR